MYSTCTLAHLHQRQLLGQPGVRGFQAVHRRGDEGGKEPGLVRAAVAEVVIAAAVAGMAAVAVMAAAVAVIAVSLAIAAVAAVSSTSSGGGCYY
jgi:hypothetical protein